MNKMEANNFWKNPLVLICLVSIGYWIYTYHFEHALGFLPYAILLLCPVMHIFMHGNHGHGEHGNNHSDDDKSDECSHIDRKEKENAR